MATREFSSGGVVYKKVLNSGTSETYIFLVTKATSSPTYPKTVWRLPKGWIDDTGSLPGPIASGKQKATEQDLQLAALREVAEEGGIVAIIKEKIGTERFSFTHKGNTIVKFVTYYLMEWDSDTPTGFGSETDEVEWLPFEKAYKKLTYSHEKRAITRANSILQKKI